MSWGIRIIFLYVGFVGMIVFMVMLTMREKVDLVTPDYYKQELEFQQTIDSKERANASGAQPTISVVDGNLVTVYPDKSVSGKIAVYRPSDSSKDFEVEITVGEDGNQPIPGSRFVKGLYKVTIYWNKDEVSHQSEYSVYMP
jgi:hypothetical protein